MTSKEMRAKKDAELAAYIGKTAAELAILKIQASIGQCEKPSQIKILKRQIARAKTIVQERQGNAGNN